MPFGGQDTVTARVVDGQGVTEVVFRRAGRWKSALLLVLLVAGWVLGAGFAALLIAADSERDWMLVLWLTVWGGAGIGLGIMMLWRLFGVESLVVRPGSLTLMRQLLLWRAPAEVPATTIEWIDWIADDPDRKVTYNGRRIPQPAIAIATARQVLRAARGITADEADKAIAAVKQRLSLREKRR